MPLDPQVAELLEQMRELPVANEVPLEQARRSYDNAAADLFGTPDPVASVEDVDADGVPVRVYRGSRSGAAAVVYLHGGGWVLGGFDSHDPLCRTLAARACCTLIAVDYRRAPEYRYPAAAQDAWSAVRWAARRFEPLAVAGDSAGGQLAAAVALRARDAGMPLALQALIYPATDYPRDGEFFDPGTDSAVLSASLMRWFWDQYVDDAARASEPDCSPLRVSDLTGLAPALVVTAEYDPLRNEGEAYASRLSDAGVPCELRRFDGLIHGFARMPGVVDRASEAIALVGSALRTALHR